MKKIFCALLTMMLLLALVACNFSTPPQSDSNTDANPPGSNNNEMPSTNEKVDMESIEISQIDAFSDGLAKFKAANGYGYMDATGQIVIEPRYQYAEDFNTLAKVQKNDNDPFLLINKNGQTVYTFTGKEAAVGEFSNGYFWVETMNETIAGDVHTMTYFDQNGNKAFTIENAAPTIRKYPASNIDKGIMVEKSLSSFNKWGYAVVTIGKYEKFIDTKGNIIPLSDLGYTDMEEDFSVTRMIGNYVSINNVTLYIDFANKMAEKVGKAESLMMNINDLTFKHLNNDYYGLYYTDTYRSSQGTSVLNHKIYRYILKDNQILFDLASIDEFGGANVLDVEHMDVHGNSYFNVLLKNKNDVIFSSIIDIEGNVVMAPSKDIILAKRSYYTEVLVSINMDYSCYNCNSGVILAKDEQTGLMGYIDVNGAFVINPTYSTASEFQVINSNAVAVVNGNTVINHKGEIIFSAQAE